MACRERLHGLVELLYHGFLIRIGLKLPDAVHQPLFSIQLQPVILRFRHAVGIGHDAGTRFKLNMFFLVKNIFSLILSLLTIGLGIAYPLKPSQITLISLFTIGIPGLFLSQMPNKELIKGRFFTNVLLKALPAGITDTIIIVAMLYFGDVFGVSAVDIGTASTILLSVVGLMIVYEISKPLDVYKMWLFIACAVGLVFSMVFVSDFFDISAMSPRCVLLCINFSIVAEPCMRYLTLGLKKLREIFTKAEKFHHEHEKVH